MIVFDYDNKRKNFDEIVNNDNESSVFVFLIFIFVVVIVVIVGNTRRNMMQIGASFWKFFLVKNLDFGFEKSNFSFQKTELGIEGCQATRATHGEGVEKLCYPFD